MTKQNELKMINLELTSVCNYCCVGCPTLNLPRGNYHMDPNLVKNIFDECGDTIEKVFLWNYGEPLLHPAIIELLNYTSKFSCEKVLSTNGSLLRKFDNFDFLKNLDELIISINGFDSKTYRLHQKAGDLEKVSDGLVKCMPFLTKSKTRTILQTVVHKGNLKQLGKAKEFAEKFGFNEFVVKSFNVMDGKKETYKKFIPEEKKFSRYSEKLNSIHQKKTEKKYPCENWIVINSDGSVNPCCWDYKGKYILGNVVQQGVYGVWNSIKSLKFREEIRKGHLMSICVDCVGSKAIRQENLMKGDNSNGTKNI